MDGVKEVLLSIFVNWLMIPRSLVIIMFFISIYQIMVYIFTHQIKIISTFLVFRGDLLTTSILTFINYKYDIAKNQKVDISL